MNIVGGICVNHAYLGDHERLDLARVRDMRANTEVDHRTAAVYRGRLAVGNLGFNEVLLVLVVLSGESAICPRLTREQHIRGTSQVVSLSKRQDAQTSVFP